MPRSHPRYDGYAAPIAPLVDARQERLYDRESNQRQRRLIAQRLEEQYQALLCRGTYAEVVVSFSIENGFLQATVRVRTTHEYNAAREEPR